MDLTQTLVPVFVCVIAAIGLPERLQGQLLKMDRDVCPEIVTTLVPQRVFKRPTNSLQRLEIRSCLPGETENLQFVVWENNATKPSIVATTSDEAIVQIAMSGGVFVIETTGGSRDFLFVIVYEGGTSFRNGKPRIALQAVTKGRAAIRTSQTRVSVDYPDLRGEQRHVEYPIGDE